MRFLTPLCLLITIALLTSCGEPVSNKFTQAKESAQEFAKARTRANALTLTFTYGSEKEKWIEAVTVDFNASESKPSDGQVITIEPIAMSSNECIDQIVNAKREVHLTSPASGVFIKLGNAKSQAKLGRDLVGPTENLVLSPIVIAMWQPMAEALGWPDQRLGWSDIHDMALNEEGWASLGFPQWGQFRFGHTHPEYSNSGILSLFAETYAAAGKTRSLLLADVQNPATGAYLGEIENTVVHYERSTDLLAEKMFSTGPTEISAAVLDENTIIESNYRTDRPASSVVAIYPKEGTFYADHPIGIVNRDYVTPAHEEAAKKYIDFLLSIPQQRSAMRYGFRPADISLSLGAPFDAPHGVDASQPETILEVPEVNVAKAILDRWREQRENPTPNVISVRQPD